MTSDELRQAYLDFFASKGHKVIPSSSLIPHGDPTLLLTNSGMVQFKPFYLGEAVPDNPRLASCQKCFRTTDIENVGDAGHLTFFEMLGNFSIGDYFKKEAIAWAWEFVTEHMNLSPERLWITVLEGDEEAIKLWKETGVTEERIVRLGEKDNWWGPAGDSGPCGPCSEIHVDLGENAECDEPVCKPGCDCGRWLEIWDLVFPQFNQDKSGKRTPLPKPSIDTGMGLERTITLLQGKTTVYDTDIFAPLLKRLAELSGKKYGSDKDTDMAMRVVAEHSRAIAFLIADGIMPSNEGRGYVLRRLLRRAALFGKRLGLKSGFLAQSAAVTIKQMKHVYPELGQREDFILKVISQEEARFAETLNTGLDLVNNTMAELASRLAPSLEAVAQALKHLQRAMLPPETMQALQQFQESAKLIGETITKAVGPLQKALTETELPKTLEQFHKEIEQLQKTVSTPEISETLQKYEKLLRIPGENVFKLYDTYGFPVELTREIAAERGFSVDMDGFAKEMDKQRERAKANQRFSNKTIATSLTDIASSQFSGYSRLKTKSIITALLIPVDSRKVTYIHSVEAINSGQEAELILNNTPFYSEMGGQIGDSGQIKGPNGIFEVMDTIKLPRNIVAHRGRVSEGSLAVGEKVTAEVNRERRLDIARNHTATHLLQAALKQVLGEHVQQRGSLVTPEHLRFDFSHLTAMTREEIERAQEFVNDKIRRNLSVYAEDMSYREATKSGAIAIFDEKYGETVRVLKIGRRPKKYGYPYLNQTTPPVSAELCGGTHAHTTGEIGFLQIISESSVGAGLRRIEAVTGRGAEQYISRKLADLEKTASAIEAKPDEIASQAQNIASALKEERRKVQNLESQLAKRASESLADKVEIISGVKLLAAQVPPARIETLREMSDQLQAKLGSAVIVLGTVYEDKPLFLASVTPDLVVKGYDAGKIIREVAKAAGGGGGGKPNLAQAGGKDKSKMSEALEIARELIHGKEH